MTAPDPSPLSFETAGAEAVGEVVALVESAYRGEASRQGWTTEADLIGGQRTDAEAVAALVAGPETSLLLARRDGALVGCCMLERRPAGRARIGMLAVRPEAQAGGIGAALLGEAERRAVPGGAAMAELLVIAQRGDLIAWYERRGYRLTERREPFPYGDERYGLPRRADLCFVVLERRLA